MELVPLTTSEKGSISDALQGFASDLHFKFFCFIFSLQIFTFLKNTPFLERAFMDSFLFHFRPILPLYTPLQLCKTSSFLVYLGLYGQEGAIYLH